MNGGGYSKDNLWRYSFEKGIGLTEVRTRAKGFKVLCANHYTMKPALQPSPSFSLNASQSDSYLMQCAFRLVHRSKAAFHATC
jgi:hypothetical protein